MKNRAVIIFFISIITCLISYSCYVGVVKEFSSKDLKWFLPYKSTDTVIFNSERNEFDTIIFLKTDTNEFSTRDFQSGYYDTRWMEVTYKLTTGSYHKFVKIGKGEENERLVLIENTSSRKNTFTEICFLGIIFSGQELQNNVRLVDENTYFFDGRKATYSRINIKEGITYFIFNTEKGILEYTDERNVKWKRKGSSTIE